MKHLTFAISVLALCFCASISFAMPLSMMTQKEQQALPDSVLEENGRHRVKRGETSYSLAKQVWKINNDIDFVDENMKTQWRFVKRVRMNQDDFRSFNLDAYSGCSADNLPEGAIVKMGNPIEITTEKKAETFGGKYSIHEYEFLGRSCGNIECRWSIMWPEDGCGLFPKGLEKLQSVIIQICFGYEDIFNDRYEAPDTYAIEVAEAKFKDLAHQYFRAELEEYRGPWDFSAKGELSWPFGMEWENETWYRRPVIVFKNRGCWNNGGNGCHDTIGAFVVSLPDGKILTERDYFREDALDELAALVGKRLDQKYDGRSFAMLNGNTPKVRTGEDCWLTLSEEGMTWWVAPYSFFPGAVGVASVTMPWDELEPFAR
ncbi:MAG: hypothetical protein IKS83_03745 [Victivallales bacterium]|nr:hypothetical protein [Victivallales bacterium]